MSAMIPFQFISFVFPEAFVSRDSVGVEGSISTYVDSAVAVMSASALSTAFCIEVSINDFTPCFYIATQLILQNFGRKYNAAA